MQSKLVCFFFVYTILYKEVRPPSPAKVGIILVREEDTQQKNGMEAKKTVGFVEFYETRREKEKLFVVSPFCHRFDVMNDKEKTMQVEQWLRLMK